MIKKRKFTNTLEKISKGVASFNETVRQLRMTYPEDSSFFRVLDEWQKQHTDYYSALHEIGYKLGVGIGIKGKNHSYQLYRPYLEFFPDNKLRSMPGTVHLSFEKTFEDCYNVLAHELIYRFIRINNFEHLIGNKSQNLLRFL